jgi:hypothetical protein
LRASLCRPKSIARRENPRAQANSGTRGFEMRHPKILLGATLALTLGALPLLTPAPARAIGCLSGGAAGAVAGHYAGHHAVLGAVGGCIAGHHMKVVQRRKAEAAAAAAKNPPATSPTPAMTPTPSATPQ